MKKQHVAKILSTALLCSITGSINGNQLFELIRDKASSHTIEHEIKNKGISIIHVKRGGGGTAHNPGQIVLYPVVKLESLGLGVNEYIWELEQIGIELLGNFGLECIRKKVSRVCGSTNTKK